MGMIADPACRHLGGFGFFIADLKGWRISIKTGLEKAGGSGQTREA